MAPPPTCADPVVGRLVEVTVPWTGAETHRVVEGTLFENPVILPGDSGRATVRVRNDGPADAVVTATIVDAELLDPDHVDDVYDYLLINGRPASALVRDHSTVHRVAVAHEATVDLPFWYALPLDDATKDAPGVGQRDASFAVHLHLGVRLSPRPGGRG